MKRWIHTLYVMMLLLHIFNLFSLVRLWMADAAAQPSDMVRLGAAVSLGLWALCTVLLQRMTDKQKRRYFHLTVCNLCAALIWLIAAVCLDHVGTNVVMILVYGFIHSGKYLFDVLAPAVGVLLYAPFGQVQTHGPAVAGIIMLLSAVGMIRCHRVSQKDAMI